MGFPNLESFPPSGDELIEEDTEGPLSPRRCQAASCPSGGTPTHLLRRRRPVLQQGMRSEQRHKAGPRPPAGTVKSTTGLCGQTPGHQGHLQSLCLRPAESRHSRGPWVRAGGLSAEKGPNPEPPPHGTTTSPTPQLSMNVKSVSLPCCPESSTSTFPVAL